MSSRILVNANQPIPKLLCSAVSDLRSALDKLQRVRAACDAMAWGENATTTPPFPSMTQELGITATTPGNTAADFYTLLQSVQANTALGASIIGEFISKVDQG